MRFTPESIRSIRAAGAVSVALLIAIASMWSIKRQPIPQIPEGYIDEITQYEGRFSSLKAYLPSKAAVCYLPARPSRDYFLTRYSIAPILAQFQTEDGMDKILNQADEGAPAASSLETGGDQVLRDFGHGLILLGRKGASQ